MGVGEVEEQEKGGRDDQDKDDEDGNLLENDDSKVDAYDEKEAQKNRRTTNSKCHEKEEDFLSKLRNNRLERKLKRILASYFFSTT